MLYFFPKHILLTEAKSVRNSGNEYWMTRFWKPIEKLDVLTYDGLADPACCEKYLKDNKHNSLNLALKICSDICPWTLSVPRSSQFSSSFALENCSLLGTDNVRGQISEHIFAPNEGYCLYICWVRTTNIARAMTIFRHCHNGAVYTRENKRGFLWSRLT